MSRLGKLPVLMPQGIDFQIVDHSVVVKGPKGSLTRALPIGVKVKQDDKEVLVELKNESKQARASRGTLRAHILNMIKGVSEGWTKQLEMVGTGYRAEVRGKDLVLNAGYSHPVIVTAPEGITFSVEKSIITVSGIDKDVVGQTAALVREVRKPEPYKGKGIKYTDEVVRRKAGKQAAKTT